MRYLCSICRFIYDEEKEECSFSSLPGSFTCPVCGSGIELFSEMPDSWVCPEGIERGPLKEEPE